MAIYLTGDTHADWQNRLSTSNWPTSTMLTKDDYLIILGDFGGVWDMQMSGKELRNLEWLTNKPWTTLFIDGNHENFDRLFSDEFQEVEMFGDKVKLIAKDVYYLQRGRVYNIDNKKIFTMGGAFSVDKAHRRAHISWWPQEEPNNTEINLAIDNLEKVDNKVDYILSHTAPERIMKEFLETNGPGIAGSDVIPDSAIKFLSFVDSTVEYKQWYFGHMHPYHIWTSNDQKFKCLYTDIVKL